MQNLQTIFGLGAGVLAFSALAIYALAILRGTTKPSRSSWFIWTVVGVMLAVSYYASGARETIWVPLAYVIGPLIISLLSIRYGEPGFTWSDRLCLGGTVASVAVWGVLLWLEVPQAAVWVLIINLGMEALGLIPTWQHAYFFPEHEDLLAWMLTSISTVLNLFAIADWSALAVIAYPLYMLVAMNAVTLTLLFARRRITKRGSHVII